MNEQIADAVRRVGQDGFTILEGVIPDDQVGFVRDEIVAAQQRRYAQAEAELAAIRAKGHRLGVEGVASFRGAINETQVFAPWLVEQRLLGVAKSFFGEHIRISCTDCVTNHPGCGRGYWHADWPYNQTNGSHRYAGNPSADNMGGIDRDAPYPTEFHAVGRAGSVLLYDSRMWHAVPPNKSTEERVALIVRYKPWWLNLEPTRPGSAEHTAMVVETEGKNYAQPELTAEAYATLPENVKPLYRHWVEGGA